MNHNHNASAYTLLLTIHSHLTEKFRVPAHTQDSYRRTIIYILPFYNHSPSLHELLRKSIPLRNEVCHFRSISHSDLMLLERLGKGLGLYPKPAAHYKSPSY